MNTVIYARYSAGPRQTDQSIDGQLRVCTEFCKQRGLTVVDTYCDRHISGRTDERPEFQRLIADAKAHKFEAVVVYKTDRFARNKYDSAIYKRELRRNGIQIFYAAEAIPEGPEGIILESLMEGLAEYYSAELAQKIKRGLNESALKCQSLGSGRPLGYTVDEQKHFQIDPESSQAVKTIFEMYIKGESNATICDYLNARGLRTSQGNLFNKNSINRIIKNRKYIGEYRYNDIVVEGGMPAIISKETFCLAQAEMERRRTHRAPVSPKAEYLLAGKLFCGHCKGPMQGVSGTGKSGNKWYYYYCANTRGKERTCDKKQVSRDRLEKAVVDFTVRYILQEDVLEELSKKVYAAQERQNNTASEIAFYKKKLAENKKAIANILRAIESGAMTQALPARLQELENEQTVIQGELSYLKGARLAFTEDQILFALLQHLDPRPGESEQDYHRRIITDFVSEVYLYDDRMLIYFNISSADGKLKHADLSAIESGVFDAGLTSSTKRNGHDVSSCPFLLAVELFLNPPSSQNSGPGCHTRDRCCLKLILHVEAEVDHVAVLHHILLAFAAELALLLGGVDTAVLDHIIIGNDLRPDEAPLDVSVDFTGGLRGLGALFDGPGAALILAVGQERDKAQQGVAALDEPIQTGFCDAQLVQEHLPVLALQLSDVLLQLGTDGQHLAALGFCQRTDLLQILVALLIGKAVLVHVGGVDDGLQG